MRDGKARLRIEPLDAAFVDAVLADLRRIAATDAGRALFRRVRESGRVVTIDKPARLDPPNAWIETAAGGGGEGTDRTVRLDPADWPNPAAAASAASDVVLFGLLDEAAGPVGGEGEATAKEAVAAYRRERARAEETEA